MSPQVIEIIKLFAKERGVHKDKIKDIINRQKIMEQDDVTVSIEYHEDANIPVLVFEVDDKVTMGIALNDLLNFAVIKVAEIYAKNADQIDNMDRKFTGYSVMKANIINGEIKDTKNYEQ